MDHNPLCAHSAFLEKVNHLPPQSNNFLVRSRHSPHEPWEHVIKLEKDKQGAAEQWKRGKLINKKFKIRDVTINREPVENRLKHVTIQIGWDAEQITIKLGVGVMNVCLRGT